MKRILLGIIGLLLILVVPFGQVHAQENWVDGDYATCLEGAIENGDVCAPAYASHMGTNQMADIVRRILGPVPGLTVTADAWQRNPEYVKQMAQGTAVGQIGNYIAMMYATPPADTVAFVRDIGQSLGFIPKQTYAQGVGFSGLAALLPLWKAFRNIAYALLAIVMIAIGFMVMLRKKIDPKTVVTVQNALPRIVFALVLITFSYAIVGVLIDVMYLMILLAVQVIQSTGLLPAPAGATAWFGNTNEQLFTTTGLVGAYNAIFPWGSGQLFDLAADVVGWNYLVGAGIGATAGAIAGALVGTLAFPVGILVGGLLGGLAGGFVVPALLGALLGIAVLFIFIRLFFMFLNAYVQIIMALLISPLQLMMEALPGSSSFSSWFKNLISNLAVFPIAAVMFMIAIVFANAADTFTGKVWTPPFFSLSASARSVSALFSLGLLFAIPQVVKSIQEALKAAPAVNAGPGAIFAPMGVATQQGMNLFYQYSMIKSGFRHGPHPESDLKKATNPNSNHA